MSKSSCSAPVESGILRCRERTLDYSGRTFVMGVLNVTPDSFSDGGRYVRPEQALARAQEMLAEGADVLDIGGESTRPGAQVVQQDEELRRVLPVIEALASETDALLSIDTYKPGVAREALCKGAHLVNDVRGLRDPEMARVVSAYGAGVCILHMQGAPATMQEDPRYADVVGDIVAFLRAQTHVAAEAGIAADAIVVDPGIGFGKTLAHNLTILRRLDCFCELGYPVLVGTSRKRFLGQLLNAPVEDRLEGTAASVAVAVSRGASGVRVHDVAAMVRVVRVADAICRGVPRGEVE
jgi:dihydropteroate synthase